VPARRRPALRRAGAEYCCMPCGGIITIWFCGDCGGLDDADLAFAFGHFEFGDVRFGDEVDQCLEFS
jgi:hypothetical protein